ncbi:hypothetical protein HanIR_Chr08g0357351 [Helianthus annuus]|nr:hypothetical protein HanIR_Chr08g0357351 [Helianthus annuus]
MLSVVSMLGNDGPLPPPKQPAFFTERTPIELNPIPSLVSPLSFLSSTIILVLKMHFTVTIYQNHTVNFKNKVKNLKN